MSDAKYNISEHFYSVQGEGAHSGRAAYFIRLMGCDQKCFFCDSAGTWHPQWMPSSTQKLNANETAALVQAPRSVFVVLTGGEPALHNLAPLIDELHTKEREVHIETAGHRPLPRSLDWITMSPKLFATPPLRENWHRADEIKIICRTPEQMHEEIRLTQRMVSEIEPPLIWLHPEWSQRQNSVLLQAMVEAVKADPLLSLGYQLHKCYKSDTVRCEQPKRGDSFRRRSQSRCIAVTKSISEETRRKMVASATGRRLTDEEKAKISAKARLRWQEKGRKEAAAQLTKQQWKDKQVSASMRIGISKAATERMTPEVRAQISKQRRGKTMAEIHGEGKAREIYFKRYGYYPEERPEQINRKRVCEWECKKWARAVYERDLFMCQDCAGYGKNLQLHAHHIRSWIDYPELRFDVTNGITLCRECHNKRHTEDKSKWGKARARNQKGKWI